MDKLQNVDQFEVWPGYATATRREKGLGGRSLMMIDSLHKVCNKTTVLEVMTDIRNKSGGNFEQEINNEIIGTSVMTVYNRTLYKIDGIDYNMTPEDEFMSRKDKKKIKFKDYYKEKYKIKIHNNGQPLLIHKDKRTGKEIYLIPELCVTTGLSEKDRANRTLMKNMARITKAPANIKLGKCKELIKDMKTKQLTREFLDEWGVKISSNPLQIKGNIIQAGNLIMRNSNSGKPINLNLDSASTNLDRSTQTKMFNCKRIKKVIVFYPQRGENEKNNFLRTLSMVTNDYDIKIEQLEQIQMPNRPNFELYTQMCKGTIKPDTTGCIFILQGGKNKGKFYTEIKQLLINNLPVPSQMILTSTISRGRNLRSIIGKMLIQFMAKLGGVPWVVDKMPFTNKPTMVIGIDISGQLTGKKKHVMTLVGTTDRNFAKYHSQSKFISTWEEYSVNLVKMFETVVKAFIKQNKFAPHRIIVFREGVSKGMRKKTKEIEVDEILKKSEELKKDENLKMIKESHLKLLFVLVSRSNGTKFFMKGPGGGRNGRGDHRGRNAGYGRNRGGYGNQGGNSNISNPVPGTFVYDNICKDKNEFFLICQKSRQGISTPTNYYILHNDLESSGEFDNESLKKALAILSYKLSFMYYNTVGSIKVPAPVHYANRMASFISERSDRRTQIIPHPHLANIRSLYFI